MAKVVAQKQLCLKAFGNHFMEWMDWVCELFPKDLDMERARTALQQVKKYNPKGLISLWYKQIYSRYKKQIDDEDFAFFLVKDYSWDIEEGYAVNADKALKVIDRIRGQLDKLKDEEKKKANEIYKNFI